MMVCVAGGTANREELQGREGRPPVAEGCLGPPPCRGGCTQGRVESKRTLVTQHRRRKRANAAGSGQSSMHHSPVSLRQLRPARRGPRSRTRPKTALHTPVLLPLRPSSPAHNASLAWQPPLGRRPRVRGAQQGCLGGLEVRSGSTREESAKRCADRVAQGTVSAGPPSAARPRPRGRRGASQQVRQRSGQRVW